MQDAPPPTLDYRAPHDDRQRSIEQRLPIVVRLILVFLGVFGPVIGLLVSMEQYPLGPEWRDGRPLGWLRVIPGGGSGLAFVPVLAFGWAALGWLCCRPALAARQAWVRVGLIGGVVTALQFCLQQAAAHAGDGITNFWSRFVGIFAGEVVGATVTAAAVVGVGLIGDAAARRHGLVGGITAWFALLVVLPGAALAAAAGLFGLEALDVLPLLWFFGIATLAAGGFLAAAVFAFVVIPRDASPWPTATGRAVLVGLAAWLGAYTASWAAGYALARRKYASLPATEPQGCYVVTAAARGPAWLTGGFPGRQLLRLKAAEHVLADRHPATHWRLRRAYDRLGPPVARRLGHPLAAAAAFVLLKPAEWCVGAAGTFATTFGTPDARDKSRG